MQKTIGLLNFIVTFTHLAAVFLLKIGVISRVYRPPSPLASSWRPQSSRIFRLWSGRLVIAAFRIDKMFVSMNEATIKSINSLSPGQSYQNAWVLFSPTLFPAMSVSTLVMVMLNGSTRRSVKELQRTVVSEVQWSEVFCLTTFVLIHYPEEQMKRLGDEIHSNVTPGDLP